MATARQREIAELRQMLATGIKRDKVDGHEVEFDLAAVQKRLSILERQEKPGLRPVVMGANLGGF